MKLYVFTENCEECGTHIPAIVIANSKEEALSIVFNSKENVFLDLNGNEHYYVSSDFGQHYRESIEEIEIPTQPKQIY